jgi:putative transposase
MEAYKGDRSITDIAEEYGVNPTQIHQWKKELMEHGPEIVAGKHDEQRQVVEAERDELYRKVGHQQVQIDFLKKAGCRSVAELRQMIEPDHRRLSARQQCDLLGLNRATLYYRPQREREEVLALMRRIDELHTAHITRGSRKMRDALRLEGTRSTASACSG